MLLTHITLHLSGLAGSLCFHSVQKYKDARNNYISCVRRSCSFLQGTRPKMNTENAPVIVKKKKKGLDV